MDSLSEILEVVLPLSEGTDGDALHTVCNGRGGRACLQNEIQEVPNG